MRLERGAQPGRRGLRNLGHLLSRRDPEQGREPILDRETLARLLRREARVLLRHVGDDRRLDRILRDVLHGPDALEEDPHDLVAGLHVGDASGRERADEVAGGQPQVPRLCRLVGNLELVETIHDLSKARCRSGGGGGQGNPQDSRDEEPEEPHGEPPAGVRHRRRVLLQQVGIRIDGSVPLRLLEQVRIGADANVEELGGREGLILVGLVLLRVLDLDDEPLRGRGPPRASR